MKKVSLFLSLLLALSMLSGIVGPALAEEITSTPLVAGTSALNTRFSPFVSETVYDRDVHLRTQLGMLVIDRSGAIVYNAADGETIEYGGVEYEYHGPANLSVSYDEAADITTYTAKLRDDLKFSDGTPLTADDVIFTYYVFLDTSYVGQTNLNSYPIVGLQNYRTQTTDDVHAKYNEMFEAIYEAGADHEWSDADAWTEEQQTWFWDSMKAVWTDDVQAIVDYVVANYSKNAEDAIGKTAEELEGNDGLKVALGMAVWGFASLNDDGVLESASGEKSWTLEGDDVPAIEDYYAETYIAYEGDPVAYWDTEQADGSDVFETARGLFIGEWGPQDEGIGEGGVPNIAGIKKLDDYTVQVQTNGYEAPAVYAIFDIAIAPMHYYGDPELYDYENNMFGFPRGDVSIIESKTTQPMGAGPYVFQGYENMLVSYVANEHFYLGKPATEYFQYRETLVDTEMAPGVQTGTIDIAEMSGSKDNFALLASYNSNGEITGDVVSTYLVDNRGYGYIGMNAENVMVGSDPFSVESKNLRKGLGTLFAVYRDVAFDTYYGEAASVIQYPISNTSWAAPQPTDEGYKAAFSVDVDGNDIYTSDMTTDERYAVALETAIGFLKAAGYTFDEATGKFTEAPEGAKMTYEATIPAGGQGDHPSFGLLTDAKNALETIGLTLKINDPANSSVLWDSINANTHEIWCAAWSASLDPDMYQVYHSSNCIGDGGTDSNNYNVAIPELDELIMAGRKSDDQAYRKAIYKEALDIIVDAAVEVPAYQRQNCVISSTERVDQDTVTPSITTNYEWWQEEYAIQMKANQ